MLGTVDMAACRVISLALSEDEPDTERARRIAHCHAGLCAFKLADGSLCSEPRHKKMKYCLKHSAEMAHARWAANREQYREAQRRYRENKAAAAAGGKA